MKTVTLDDLKDKFSTIVGWVENGEDVFVQGKPSTRINHPQGEVDWSTSAALRHRARQTTASLSVAELQGFYQDMRGSH